MWFVIRRAARRNPEDRETWELIERVYTDAAPTGGSWTKRSRYTSRGALVHKFLPQILGLYI